MRVSKICVPLRSKTNKAMGYDISEQISQGSDGSQDAENRRIAAIADELSRLCRVHETQSGIGKADVNISFLVMCLWTARAIFMLSMLR